MFKQIFQYCAGFSRVLGIVRYCAGLTELCGPAPAHPVRRPDSGSDVELPLLSIVVTALRQF